MIVDFVSFTPGAKLTKYNLGEEKLEKEMKHINKIYDECDTVSVNMEVSR